MAITDRSPAPPAMTTDVREPQLGPEPTYQQGESSPVKDDAKMVLPLSAPARITLATLSATVGAIYMVWVPSRVGEWLPEGLVFAAIGWLQIGLAFVFLARPSRFALRLSCLANAAFVAGWVLIRTAGLPFGPHAGRAETSTFVGVVGLVLQAVLIVLGYELLIRPDRGAHLARSTRLVLLAAPIAIIALATAAMLSPNAINLAYLGDPSAVSAGGAPGTGAPGGATSAAVAQSDGHDHGAGATPADDKGLSKIMNGQGDGGGHPSHDAPEVKLDAATQRKLDAQLAQTRLLIDKYPTVKDAEAAGWRRSGPYAPGLGTHYTPLKVKMNTDGKMDQEDIDSATLIYDGLEPDSKLAGFMYQIFSLDTTKGPEGFAGDNDHWHYHANVCIVPRPGGGVDAPLGADTTAPKELCDKYGGVLIANTGYMVHVWTVPGYESSKGVFSNVNPAITCADGTYHILKLDEIGTRTTVCVDGSSGGRRQ